MTSAQRELYRNGLKYFELNDLTKSILKPMIAGDDKATDFEDTVKTDRVISRQIILDANLQLKNGSVQSISHAVVLIGKNRVRNLIFSNCILSFMTDDQDAIFEKITKEKSFLKYSEESENFAKKLGCEFLSSAWAAGFLYDFLDHLLVHKGLKTGLSEDFQDCWAHGTKTAALAWSLANVSKLSATQCRLAYLAGLTHDIGRILMWIVYDKESVKINADIARLKENQQWENTFEIDIERKYLNISHAEIGGLLLTATEFMGEVEEVVAFHHDLELLKIRSAKHFQVGQCVNLADRIADKISRKAKITEAELVNLIGRMNFTAAAVQAMLSSLPT